MGAEQIGKKVLIITAVAAERDAVLRGLQGDKRFDVLAGGVGPVAAAVSTANTLHKNGYGLVISAGIGGGFTGLAEVGSLVVANAIIAADLGAETPDGFRSVEELGFGTVKSEVDAAYSALVYDKLVHADLPVHIGTVVTLTTVTGTAETAEGLAMRIPGAACEAMEGFGVAEAARQAGLPVLEIRAISNAVGPRDRAAWRIGEALERLSQAFSVIKEVII